MRLGQAGIVLWQAYLTVLMPPWTLADAGQIQGNVNRLPAHHCL
jgi:hypothetical protein